MQTSVELKQKISSSRDLYISHFESVQNIVRLHKAGSNGALEELSALASSNSQSIEEVSESFIFLLLIAFLDSISPLYKSV